MVRQKQPPRLNKINQIVIAAGGAGTRLVSEGIESPKALVNIDGIPVLSRMLRLASSQKIERATLLLHHGSNEVISFYQNVERLNIDIDYSIESAPLGNGGCLKYAQAMLNDCFFYVYGDLIFNVDLNRMASQHFRSQADITLFAHPSDHPFDADLIDATEDGRVHKIHNYPHNKRPIRNLVNSAIYILSRSVVDLIPPVKSDFARDILPLAIKRGLKVMVYRSREYVKDMGTPERIQKVTEHIRQGLLEKMQIKNPIPVVYFTPETLVKKWEQDRPEFVTTNHVEKVIGALNDCGCLCILALPKNYIRDAGGKNNNLLLRSIDDHLAKTSAFFDDHLEYSATSLATGITDLHETYNFDAQRTLAVSSSTSQQTLFQNLKIPVYLLSFISEIVKNNEHKLCPQSFFATLEATLKRTQ
ncbi:nucleotidyltransferase family protein [Candidatus Ponderosibacter sp. Uisw_141_02]|uniref:nucleotidyltransferase family protein n=1 Tax=Candidatus Ponderosibacter sp. Uisw_141_02 TaxID=3231000 RepID=UPI003D45BFCA